LRIFKHLRGLQDELGFSCLLLTRSLEQASSLADEIVVLHAGQIVESGSSASLIKRPHHPYTQSLLGQSLPAPSEPPASGGSERPAGCRFRARCPHAFVRCAKEAPSLVAVAGGLSRCFLHDSDSADA
jgi:oligopeptide/dipeptide ABC transporter ATP-binding protein